MYNSLKKINAESDSLLPILSRGLLVFFSFCLWFIVANPSAVMAQDETRVIRRTVTLGAQNQKSLYGGFVDLATGRVYSLSDVHSNQAIIDLIYAFGSSTGVNLMLPSSAAVGNFGSHYRTQVAQAWKKRNRGSLVALKDDRGTRRLFKSIKNNQQLREAYDQAQQEVNSRPGYSKALHGPGARIQKLETGDFFVLHSRDRNIFAIGRLVDLKEGYQGYVTLDLKISRQ